MSLGEVATVCSVAAGPGYDTVSQRQFLSEENSVEALENHLAFVPVHPCGMYFVAPHMCDPWGFLLCFFAFLMFIRALLIIEKNLERAPTFID